MGELTGELEEFGSGSFIEKHVSSGPTIAHVLSLPQARANGRTSVRCRE